MINEITAERSRWTAERDGFARMTEALISRHSRGKDHESSYRENVCPISTELHFLFDSVSLLTGTRTHGGNVGC